MEQGRTSYLYVFALLLWLAAFAAEVRQIGRWAWALAKSVERTETQVEMLNRQARENVGLVKQARYQSQELEFLDSLPNILPQDKGYLRTQKAISDEVQGLRRKLSRDLRDSLHVIVDAKANKLYFKKGFKLLWQADCSVGRGGSLIDKKTGRRWVFVTPRGEFKVMAKAENPEWKKPDWAYVESGEPIPPPEDSSRIVLGELGPYVLNLGDGYLIHG